MIASTKVRLSDLSGQKRFSTDLDGDLTPAHSVSQAIDLFLDRTAIPRGGRSFTAFSRGVLLDGKSRLAELPEQDTEWKVMPEVSAGAP